MHIPFLLAQPAYVLAAGGYPSLQFFGCKPKDWTNKDDLMMNGILNTTFHGHDDKNTKWRFFDVLFPSTAVLSAFIS